MRVLLIFYVILGLLFIGCKSQLQTDIIKNNRSKVLEKINSDSLRQLNQVQGLGLTILHTAVVANDQTVVKALISRKINLDTKSTSIKNSEKIILFLLLMAPWGFLNILYKPIVNRTIIPHIAKFLKFIQCKICLLYTSPSPRDS